MKLSDIKGEKAIDVLAEIIEPLAEIFSDPEVAEAGRKQSKAKAVSVALKKHKEKVLYVLAVLDEEDPETYSPSLVSLPAKVLDILADPEVSELFTSQGQKEEETPSGSAMEITEATESE